MSGLKRVSLWGPFDGNTVYGSFNGKVGIGKSPYIKGGTNCIWISENDSDHTVRGDWYANDICFGVITYPKGLHEQRYEGRSQYGVPDGSGTMIYANGDVYAGEWQNNSGFPYPHGTGTYTFADGTKFSGNWVAPGNLFGLALKIKNGERYRDGERYIGVINSGKKHGVGRCYYVNGDYYHGEWDNEKRCGTGKYVLADGTVQEGLWENDVFVNGKVYEGHWENGRLNGLGKVTQTDGTYYEGLFENGIFREGHGRIVFSNGNVYEGQLVMCDDGIIKQDGEGKLTQADGSVMEAYWNKGVRGMQGEPVMLDP